MRGLVLSLFLGLAAPSAKADPATEALTQLLTAAPKASQFAPAFLDAVPVPELAVLLEDLSATIGQPTDSKVTGEAVLITTATHRLRGQIGIDAEGRVAMLFFEPPEPLVADLDTALAAIRALGAETVWLVARDGVTLASEGASKPMAVASAFKPGVLAVLAEDVQTGRRRWEDVVVLDDADISLPTGLLQDYPVGAPMTLHTAAAAYLSAAPAEQATIAAKAAKTLPRVTNVIGHYMPGIEWHVPLDRLCALAAPLADLPLMAINPGPVPAEDWARRAYKGGSEPGVLNFTAVLQDAAGRDLCVAVTVNSDREVDLAAAVSAFRGLLAVLSAPG